MEVRLYQEKVREGTPGAHRAPGDTHFLLTVFTKFCMVNSLIIFLFELKKLEKHDFVKRSIIQALICS